MSVVLATTVLLAAGAAYGQDAPTQPQPSRTIYVLQQVPPVTTVTLADVPEPPEPPAINDGWSLRVHTSGGFAGQGAGSVTISSDGRLACESATCAPQVERARLTRVATTITSLAAVPWIRQAPSSFCRDCVQTTVVLKRREGDVVRTYVASWDASQPVTAELRELRRLVLELQTAAGGR